MLAYIRMQVQGMLKISAKFYKISTAILNDVMQSQMVLWNHQQLKKFRRKNMFNFVVSIIPCSCKDISIHNAALELIL